MKEQTKNILLLMGFIYIILGIIVYLGTAITGYVIYIQSEYNLNIIPENFIYNSSEILIEDNKISLYPNTITEDIIKTNTQNSYIISAKRENVDFTQEVIALDNSTVNTQKNKKFNIIFDSILDNENIIRLYMKETGEATTETLYLCNYDEECSLNQSYGSALIDKEGWYEITLKNLEQPTDKFNLYLLTQENPATSVLKIDYIDALKEEITNYTNTIINYLLSAEIISKEINPNGTIYAVIINETQNGNTITNYYSFDGQNWNELIDEILNSTNNKIILKSILTSTNNQTPEINGIKIIYLQSTEEEQNITIPELNETQNQTIEDNIIMPVITPPAASGGGGGGGGGSSNKIIEEQPPVINPPSEITTEVYELPKQEQKEAIVIGQTEVPKPQSNAPFLVGLTAKIVYSGKGMIKFLGENWGWLLLIILLLIGYIYLYLKRRSDRRKFLKKKLKF